MAPLDKDAPPGLSWPGARRFIAIVLGVFIGLPLLVHLALNELARRAIGRVNAAGGVVSAKTDHDSDLEHRLSESPRWVQAAYVVRPRYSVAFGLVPVTFEEALGGSTPALGELAPRDQHTHFEGRAGDPGDEGLAVLRGLGHVVELSLVETSVSDEGLRQARDAGPIEELDLERTRVTGEGLAYLRGLPLRWLSLAETPIDDRALARVVELEHLTYLSLALTRVTGPGVARLATMRALEHLDLSNTNLLDDDLLHLEALGVRNLDLAATDVTDAGLAHLARIPKLEGLFLCSTRATYEGIQGLRAVRPELTVVWAEVDCGPWTSEEAIRAKRRPPR